MAVDERLLAQLYLMDSGARLPAIVDLLNTGQLGKGEEIVEALREILPRVWSMEERPSYSQKGWLMLFGFTGYCSDTDERLTGTLPIHRGTQSPRYARGLSWTLDAEKAEWFAKRLPHRDGAFIYATQVEADSILGYFVDRNESEVVVDPSKLPRLRGRKL